MAPAPLPSEETARLDALWRTGILDTGGENFFEDLVDMMQAIVPAPAALVSFVDERRVWLKARRGFDAEEAPREETLTAHAILDDAPLVVRDTSRDGRFSDRRFTAGAMPILAYAGAPIVLACGSRLGAVAVLDSAPRAWTTRDVAHLQRGARMVSRYMETRRADLEKDRPRFLEQALMRAEKRYRSIIDAVFDGVVVHGPSGAIIDCNAAASDLLGLTRDELFGRVSNDPRWRAVRPSGEDFPAEEHPAMISLRTGEPQLGVILGVETPHGERRWLEINAFPVNTGVRGAVDQAIAVFRRVAPPVPQRKAI